jgi:hypothetical protein
MGLFFKKNIIGQYPHDVLRKDWENVMDALFRNTIANYAKGVAVICNTSRKDPADGSGIVQQELVYHIRSQRVNEVRRSLKKIDTAHFENIFKNYFDSSQKSLDFYRIKNILAKEIMVYPLVHGEDRKGLLVFDHPISDSNSVHIMQVIKDVLNNPEVESAPPPEDEKRTS